MAVVAKESETPENRGVAISALAEIGPPAEVAVPLLLKMLQHKNARLRCLAARALGPLGASSSKQVLPALLEALNDPDLDVQACAVGELCVIRKDPKTVVPAIITIFKKHKLHKGHGDPRECAVAVVAFGRAAKPVVPLLVDILEDGRERHALRLRALRALQELGSTASEAIPTLKRFRNDPLSIFPERDLDDVLAAIQQPGP